MRTIMSRLSALCLLLCCTHLAVNGQSEKEIVAKYKSAISRLLDDSYSTTIEMKGVAGISGLSIPFTMHYKPVKNMRMEMKLQTLTFIVLQNDSLKWEYNSMTRENKITPVKADEMGEAASESTPFDFINKDLAYYAERKHKVKLKGKIKLDSVEVFQIELTRKEKKASTIYVRTSDYLIYAVRDNDGQRYFLNYRNYQEFPFPQLIISSEPKQTMEFHFESIIFGLPIPDSLFVIPKYAFEKKSNAKKVAKKINESLITKGENFYKAQKYDSAFHYFDKSVREDGDNYSALNYRGLARLSKQEYYDAIVDFKRASELAPEAWAPVNNLGLAKDYLSDHKGAVADYTKALSLFPAGAIIYRNRGFAYAKLNQLSEAEADFLSWLKIENDAGEAYYQLGTIRSAQEKYPEAVQFFNRAINFDYRTTELLNYRGVAFYKMEMLDSAVLDFRDAHKEDPKNLQYLSNYGNTLYWLEDFDNARMQFEAYLKIDNNDAEIHNLLGLCDYSQENFKGAISHFTRAIERDGKNALYCDNRAAAKENIQDYQGAIADLGESIRLHPTDPDVFYKRGLLKIRTSKKMEGCLDLTTAHEMKYEPAKEAIMKNCN